MIGEAWPSMPPAVPRHEQLAAAPAVHLAELGPIECRCYLARRGLVGPHADHRAMYLRLLALHRVPDETAFAAVPR